MRPSIIEIVFYLGFMLLKNKEQRTKNKEQRTKNKEQKIMLCDMKIKKECFHTLFIFGVYLVIIERFRRYQSRFYEQHQQTLMLHHGLFFH